MQTEVIVSSYRKHKNLFHVGRELGMPWQTVYVHLRSAGEPVTGDKARWGSVKDQFAARAEDFFQGLVPSAENMNQKQWQSKYDFAINGCKIDVKGATARRNN